MSAENAQTLDNTTYMHEEYALLQDLEEYQQDILGGLSVLVNDNNNLDNAQVQEVVLDEQLLNTLTAVTLPDGTQAFVAQNLVTNEAEKKESQNKEATLKLDNGAILLGDIAELNNEKVIQVQLDQLGDEFSKNENIILSDGINVYPHLQIVNGAIYLVTNQFENCQNLYQGSDEEPKNDAIFSTANQNDKEMSESKHECPRENCTEAFSTLHHLKVHERTHTDQRPYMCTQPKCKKSFSTTYSLKAHLRTHTEVKPFKCTSEDCDKRFKTSGDLMKHVRTHTGERPFVCPFNGCGRSFTTSNIRKVHIRTHTGERPFKCPHPKCGKAFASSTNYKNHVRIHSGEKPYVCTIENCGKRFTEYSSLYKHQIVHTQEKPYECDLCPKQYRQHSTLVLHKKTVHQVADNENDNDKENDNDQENEHDDDDDVLDVLLENSVDMIENSVEKMNQATDIAYVNNSQFEVSPRGVEQETQILVVEDPSQLVTLQATLESLNEGPDNPIDIALDELNNMIMLNSDGINRC